MHNHMQEGVYVSKYIHTQSGHDRPTGFRDEAWRLCWHPSTLHVPRSRVVTWLGSWLLHRMLRIKNEDMQQTLRWSLSRTTPDIAFISVTKTKHHDQISHLIQKGRTSTITIVPYYMSITFNLYVSKFRMLDLFVIYSWSRNDKTTEGSRCARLLTPIAWNTSVVQLLEI